MSPSDAVSKPGGKLRFVGYDPFPSSSYINATIQSVSRQDDPKRVLEFEEARELVITTVRSLAQTGHIEEVSLLEAHGRILAERITADRDYPSLRRSLRDGFAVHSADLPGTLRIRGEVRAGEQEKKPLEQARRSKS